MNNIDPPDDLNTNTVDHLVTVIKGSLGAIPIAGSVLSELIGSVIPNQKLDRLVKYVRQLEVKLSLIPIEKINSLVSTNDFIDLVEEGFIQASRATTDQRRDYITSLITNGISETTIELQDSKYLLKLLQELNDIEIIWLRLYYERFDGAREEFRKKHPSVLYNILVYSGCDEETINKSAIQLSYTEHLARLELIRQNLKINRASKLPEFNSNTGQPIRKSITITALGTLLLKQIGLIDSSVD